MYAAYRLAIKYIGYYLTASNGKGHGIHSPFVYDFIAKVLNDKRHFYAYDSIEDCRNRLLLDNRLLDVEDFGAGSVTGNTKQKKIAAIARNAAKPKKWGQLLFRISNYYKPGIVIELGTSLGLSAAYMAMGNENGKVITLEGAGAILAEAKKNFSSLQINNIETIAGNFDETLYTVVSHLPGAGLVFIDGNHRKTPTLRYFEQLLENIQAPGIFIFDDIHWSHDMELAWQEIKNHPRVMLTIDLFLLGLVFINPDFKVKQHFVIRF